MADDARKPWMKFYPADWQADEGLRQCSLAARGLWIELVAAMHKSAEYGHLLIAGKAPTDTQIAVMVGSDAKTVRAALGELEQWGVFTRQDGTITSRRMVRDNRKAEQDRSNGKGGGNPNVRGKSPGSVKGGVNPPDNPDDNPPVNGGDKARATRVPEARGQRLDSPKAPMPDIADVLPDRATGQPTVNGWLLNDIGEACLEAAQIDPARWRGDWKPVIAWLRDGFDGSEIAGVIARRASRPGYSPPFSLSWFDAAVRQECPMDATRVAAGAA